MARKQKFHIKVDAWYAGPWRKEHKEMGQEPVIEANCEIRVHKDSAKAGQTN